MPYKTMIDNLKDGDHLYLNGKHLGDKDIKCLAHALKGSQMKGLYLSNNCIRDEGVKILAESLKDTQIVVLNLSNNSITCNGLKYLSQVLKGTKIRNLILSNNDIMDEGVIALTDSIKGTEIVRVDLRGNKIGCDAGKHLNELLSNSPKIECLFVDIHCTKDGIIDKYISLQYFKEIYMKFHNNKIGTECAEYLNKTFQNFTVAHLKLDHRDLDAEDAQYLAQAFKDAKIIKLFMYHKHIMQFNSIKYLVKAFKDCRIVAIIVCSEEIGNRGAKYLAEILRDIKDICKLIYVGQSNIGDEAMKYLVPVLKNSDIMYIDFGWNNITDEGVRYLSKILPNSKIVSINLCNNRIGDDGAKCLADSLPYSQVTDISLGGNSIGCVGYQYLFDVAGNTNVSKINLHNGDEAMYLPQDQNYTMPWVNRNPTIARKIRNVFKELVSLNPISNEFEFIVPTKNTSTSVDIDQYAFLIVTLKDNPNLKVHIIDMMCDLSMNDTYDFNTIDNINKFIAIMPGKFNKFINTKLPDLIQSFRNYNFVNLVKQFEDMKLYDIVQNLLLHRVLYYVDEDQEILHPYIYKMLNKYSMPLYSEQLEPNKKEGIISYYQSHKEIDAAEEVIDLLKSESFQ